MRAGVQRAPGACQEGSAELFARDDESGHWICLHQRQFLFRSGGLVDGYVQHQRSGCHDSSLATERRNEGAICGWLGGARFLLRLQIGKGRCFRSIFGRADGYHLVGAVGAPRRSDAGYTMSVMSLWGLLRSNPREVRNCIWPGWFRAIPPPALRFEPSLSVRNDDYKTPSRTSSTISTRPKGTAIWIPWVCGRTWRTIC